MMSTEISIILCLCGFLTTATAIGGTSYGNYTLVERPLRTTAEAAKVCRGHGMTLVNIETQAKFDEITQALEHIGAYKMAKNMSDIRYDFWTGGVWNVEQDRYVWSTGVHLPIDANYWAPGRPVEDHALGCVMNGYFAAIEAWGLRTEVCDNRQNFMCEKGVANENPNKIDELHDYSDHFDHNKPPAEPKYTIVAAGRYTFDDARQRCNNIGADVVNFETSGKWLKYLNLIEALGLANDRRQREMFWTGGRSYKDNIKKFFWSNGQEFSAKAGWGWGKGEPNDRTGEEYCISITMMVDKTIGLNDMRCGSQLGYICESRQRAYKPNSSPKINGTHMQWQDLENEIISQVGFGMLESGCVSIKNEVNIMMKNVVDIVLGGLTYWMFGFAFSFGRSPLNNGFIALGDFFVDPSLDDPLKGAIYAAFIFQLSFATTATTIVSGAMAERCNFKAYCIFSFLNTAVYCIPAGWMWGDHGFLKRMGVVDIAGSGAVHLIGGSSAFASALMLGPRLGRYDNGIQSLPLGNPVNAVMGLFVLWWGWLAFNSGSTYGLSGEKWHYAARAAVMTMMSSFGGGCVSILYSFIRLKGRIDTIDIINGILGALVAITAGCFLYEGWEALLVGAIGALLACSFMPIFDLMGVDDPVGASAVHGIGGIWGVLAVGIFAENPYPLDTTSGRSGLLNGGGWYLLGVQSLAALCLTVWGIGSTIVLLWCINKVVTIRMEVHAELLGADLTEHFVKHGNVGVSVALSALRPVVDTTEVEHMDNVGMNPMHAQKLNIVKNLSRRRHYKFSKILKDITKSRSLGINLASNLLPKRRRAKKVNVPKTDEDYRGMGNNKPPVVVHPDEGAPPAQMAWVN